MKMVEGFELERMACLWSLGLVDLLIRREQLPVFRRETRPSRPALAHCRGEQVRKDVKEGRRCGYARRLTIQAAHEINERSLRKQGQKD